ncbi:MAG: glycosyltransferase family 9 protein, partial [Deltaproteobacteria bacterium]|nr:glycosyltransferase family 9 protein [Deltaproteobacteria bacterium]
MTGQGRRRILVLRFSSAGDVLLTSPALAALKAAWPDSEIVYAVKEAFAPVIHHNPYVDRVVTLARGEGVWSFARRLRPHGPFAAVLDLHGKLRSRLLRLLVGAPAVVWKKRPWRDELPVRLMLRPYRAHATVAARYHAAVEALVGRTLAPEPLGFWVGDGEQAEADAALVAAGVVRGRPLLGMAPGANWATKRWPVQRFAALARRAQAAGFQVMVVGSSAESPLAGAIAAAS